MDKRDMWPDDDDVIFVPDKEYHTLNRALLDVEIAIVQLKKAKEEKKSDSKTEQPITSRQPDTEKP